MIVSARARANRRNALLSTGPKTAAGKRRAALNATTHGLSARTYGAASGEVLELARNWMSADGGGAPAAPAIVAAQAHLDLLRLRRFQEGLMIAAFDAPSEQLGPLLVRVLRLDRYAKSAVRRRDKALAKLDVGGLARVGESRAPYIDLGEFNGQC